LDTLFIWMSHKHISAAFGVALCFMLTSISLTDAQRSRASKAEGTSVGSWSTAFLKVARADLAAASLPNYGLAIFAGGQNGTVLNTVDIFNATSGNWSTAELTVARFFLTATSLPNHGLAIFAGGCGSVAGDVLSSVDIFNANSGIWSTAELTVARWALAATSLPNHGLALFAGGHPTADDIRYVATVDIFNAISGNWSTAELTVARSDLSATSLPNHGLAIFAGGCCSVSGDALSTVDIFNANSGIWSTAELTVARWALAATSLPNHGLALFAGGRNGSLSAFGAVSAVDIFNVTSRSWNSSVLSVARSYLSSTSLSNDATAIFAGGLSDVLTPLNTVDIFDVFGSWSAGSLNVSRCSLAATSLPNHGLAIFAGGSSIQNPGQTFNAVDIFMSDASPPSSTSAPSTSPLPSSTIMSTTAAPTAVPNVTSSPHPTSSTPFIPAPVPVPSPIPTWIVAAAAATSGHLPRALELIQFLSIYCTSLSSEQQIRVSEFQVASFTHISSSKTGYCDVCPGSCTRPLALVVPAFALLSCLFALCIAIVVVDAYKARDLGRFRAPLLESSAESSSAESNFCSSLLMRTISEFCVLYFRGMIETCSAYLLIPCTFTFVLNMRPSSFAQANSSDRAMILMLPVMMLLFRALVIRQRVVDMTSADQN